MREYRGKRIDNGEWVYGWYHEISRAEQVGKAFIIPSSASVLYSYEVDPSTVGQDTGLKDKNGKEIYEGDVLQFEDVGEEGYEYSEGYDFTNRAAVIFEDGRFTLDKFMDMNSAVLEEINENQETCNTMKFSEVIGSLHDNPELLEVTV